jgi:putative hydrolase of the HAD superfamily
MSRNAVAFDLGGVVVDVVKDGLAAFSDVDAFFGARHDAFSVGALDADAYLAAVAHDVGAAADVVGAAWSRVVSWSPGGLALLAATCRWTRVLVWSNTDPLHWQVLGDDILAAGVAAADVFVSFRLGVEKPDPRFFARALAAAGLDAKDVVYLDDRADNVAAARGLGVDAVVVKGVAAAAAVLAGRRG